jgi:predicted RNA polymerase sigma factor
MAQRISRAKQTLKDANAQFGELLPAERASRLPAVMHVLYLVFNEGYAASSGNDLIRLDLSNEALRLTLAPHHRLHAARGHLLERAGDAPAAISCYRYAASLTASIAERDYLYARAARLEG